MPSAADIIAAARMTVHYKHPYLAHVLFALRPHPAPGLGTLSVDQGWRLYYDPETVVQWHEDMIASRLNKVAGSDKEHDGLAAAVFHELGHCLREHALRIGERNKVLWNWAGDREINDDLIEAGWRLPIKMPFLPEQIGMKNGLTAEEYYEEDRKNTTIVTVQIGVPGGGSSCGGASGNPTEWEKEHGEDGDAPAPCDKMDQEIVLRQTAESIAKHVKENGKGSVPLGLQVWAETKLEPAKIDWRRRLAAMTRGALASITGACDWTWRKTGRRSIYSAGRAGWPLAPALHQPTPRVGVVLDTSGSMNARTKRDENREVIEDALSEVLGIAQSCGCGATVYACDAAVHAGGRVRAAGDLNRVNYGGGGTDMRPGFQAAKKDHADFIVIVTDGIVGDDWPSQEEVSRTKTLAVLVGEAVKPPSWIPWVEAV